MTEKTSNKNPMGPVFDSELDGFKRDGNEYLFKYPMDGERSHDFAAIRCSFWNSDNKYQVCQINFVDTPREWIVDSHFCNTAEDAILMCDALKTKYTAIAKDKQDIMSTINWAIGDDPYAVVSYIRCTSNEFSIIVDAVISGHSQGREMAPLYCSPLFETPTLKDWQEAQYISKIAGDLCCCPVQIVNLDHSLNRISGDDGDVSQKSSGAMIRQEDFLRKLHAPIGKDSRDPAPDLGAYQHKRLESFR